MGKKVIEVDVSNLVSNLNTYCMLHLSIAWFALLLIIGASILIKDHIKFLKYIHERKAHQAELKASTTELKQLVPQDA